MAERSYGPGDGLIPGVMFAMYPVRGRAVGCGQCLGGLLWATFIYLTQDHGPDSTQLSI